MLLPDSRTQIVKYMADDANGYTADVQYEGQAQFSRGGIGSGAYGAPSGTYGAPGGTGGFQGGYQGGKYNFNCTYIVRYILYQIFYQKFKKY